MDGIPVMLVGNKCDEESGKREVGKKTGEALQVKPDLPNFMTQISLKFLLFKSSLCGNVSTSRHQQRMAQMLMNCLKNF